MDPRRVCKVLFGLTFVLLLVGGVVHSTGSSLACPDWPLCFRQVFPAMVGGVRYEHSHRLLASLVGFTTLSLLALLWRDAGRRRLALLGAGLVVVQGLLGGLTVLLRLPPLVSVAHFGTSMGFFAWIVVMLFRLQAPQRASSLPAERRLMAVALGCLYTQLVLGAAVRHLGASMSCGTEALSCAGALLPSAPPQWLQTTHRVMALVTLAAIVAATVRPMKRARLAGQVLTRRLGLGCHLLVVLQIILGVLTLKTGVHLHVVTTHLGLGALLWATSVAFYLSLAPQRASLRGAADASLGAGELHGTC